MLALLCYRKVAFVGTDMGDQNFPWVEKFLTNFCPVFFIFFVNKLGIMLYLPQRFAYERKIYGFSSFDQNWNFVSKRLLPGPHQHPPSKNRHLASQGWIPERWRGPSLLWEKENLSTGNSRDCLPCRTNTTRPWSRWGKNCPFSLPTGLFLCEILSVSQR